MDMRYISTRGGSAPVTGAEAIIQGLAPDGGLYIPETMPALPPGYVETMFPMTYAQRAAQVLALFLPEFSELGSVRRPIAALTATPLR